MINSIQELMENLHPYISLYMDEMNIQLDNRGFVKCLNPEHDDHNPSMHFWDENNLLFCFSCGATYDIFGLCSLLEGKPDCGPDFIEENVFYLARKYGLDYEHLRKDITQEEIKRNNMFKIMRVFGEYLLKHKNQDYLDKRNINEKTSRELIIGSVDNYKNAIDYIKQKVQINDIDSLLKEIGFDSFKVNENKLIFIIKDRFGRPCSFVSREMIDTVNNPKYINGKESEIYNKSSIFYGYSDIKKKFNHLDVFLIVEGYIDFVSAYQAGFRNVVALGSASFTDEHIELLERDINIDKIAIALDNDATGKKRTEDLINRFKMRKLKKTYVVAVNKSDKYKDLDEAIQDKEKNNEKLNLREMYEIIDLFEFELRKIKESGNFDESLVFEKFINIISQTKSPKTREEQAKTLSKYINYSSKTILDEIEYRLESDNESYKNDIKKAFQFGLKEVEKNSSQALSILKAIEEDIEDIDKQYNKVKGDIFQTGLEDFDSYEEKKTIQDLFMINFHIPWLNHTALVPGKNTVISGPANSGKTTVLQYLGIQVALREHNGFVLYISTDDSAEKIYSNFVAQITGLPREYTSNPNFHKTLGRSLNTQESANCYYKYLNGVETLKRLIEHKKLLVLDVKRGIDNWTKFTSVLRDIGSKEELDDKFKILIVDSANKIDVGQNIQDQIGFISGNIKKLSSKYNFCTFINYELNKAKNNARLTQFNLSGSRRMNYDTDLLGFVYNPSRNLEGNTDMWWDKNGYKNPVIVTVQEKTKVGNNERTFRFYFYKLDSTTSALYPIEFGSQEHNYYENIFNKEWEEKYENY